MTALGHRLHAVAGPRSPVAREPDLGTDGDRRDVALTATIFAVCAVPLLGVLAHVGRWGGGTLGLGAAGSLLAGRELWASARAALRARRAS